MSPYSGKDIIDLKKILSEIAKNADVLPAVGGATEELQSPDEDEKIDQILNKDESMFDSIFETNDEFKPRYVPPLPRARKHLFRFFLDGSFRSYFLGTLIEENRNSPVTFSQIATCVLKRDNNGNIKKEKIEKINTLIIAKANLSDQLWEQIEKLTVDTDIKLINLNESDLISSSYSDIDLRNKSIGKVRYLMHELESKTIEEFSTSLDDETWLIADGSLLFEPLLSSLISLGREIIPILGVAKNFRKDPEFMIKSKREKKRYSIYKLLAELPNEHRTPAFSARDGKIVFWYLRIREQKHLDYPLMGVVKVELVNPSLKPVDSELIDLISRALVAERNVTPHGKDRRWHAHLYPIYLCEQFIRENLISREVIQQYLKWR